MLGTALETKFPMGSTTAPERPNPAFTLPTHRSAFFSVWDPLVPVRINFVRTNENQSPPNLSFVPLRSRHTRRPSFEKAVAKAWRGRCHHDLETLSCQPTKKRHAADATALGCRK